MPVIPVAVGSSEEDGPPSPDGVIASSGVGVRGGGAAEEAASFGRHLEEVMAAVGNGEDRDGEEEQCTGGVAYHHPEFTGVEGEVESSVEWRFEGSFGVGLEESKRSVYKEGKCSYVLT